MNLAGITRVRNEAHIIRATLDHAAEFCNGGIWVFDDASEDNTVSICRKHPAVMAVICKTKWEGGSQHRQRMEGVGRQLPYDDAMKSGADYIYCFDADERAEFTHFLPNGIDFVDDAYALRLFDFYITPGDEFLDYTHRRKMGPEYRDIPMIFKARPRLWRDRVPEHTSPAPVVGYCKHYGKAISVEEWEKTCDYYVNHRWAHHPELRARWGARRGKAVHAESDFGRELITWADRGDPQKIVKL